MQEAIAVCVLQTAVIRGKVAVNWAEIGARKQKGQRGLVFDTRPFERRATDETVYATRLVLAQR